MVAEGKIYFAGGDKQTVWVLAAGKELKVLQRIRLRDGIYTTPTVANGALYIVTNKHVYAVGR